MLDLVLVMSLAKAIIYKILLNCPEDNNQSLRNVEVRILSKNISSLIHIYTTTIPADCAVILFPLLFCRS